MIWQYPERLAGDDQAAVKIVKHGSQRPVIPRRQTQRRRFLPGDAGALGSPDDQTATLPPAYCQTAR